MKIDITHLKEYIIKVSLSGTIPTINLNFKEDGVHTAVKNESHVAMTIGKLKSSVFEDYQSIGEIFIKNTMMFIDLLKTFDEDVTLEKDGDNMLKIFNSKRCVNIMLAEEKICSNLLRDKKPKIDTTIETTIDKSVLKRALSDMKILNVNTLKFDKRGDKLIIRVGNKKEYDYIDNIIDISNDFEDFKVGLGASFPELVNSIGDSVLVKMGNNTPMIFIDEDERMVVETIIAPFVDGDE